MTPMTNPEPRHFPLKDPASTIRILVADDHEVMRLGIRNLLEVRSDWRVCAEASNGKEAVDRAIECRPDVIILDVAMPTMNGIEAATRIAAFRPDIPIILFSLHLSDDLLDSIPNRAIRGAVCKSEAGRDLIHAVEAVLEGGTFFRGKKSFPVSQP
ncbi:MAG TPA: response regulator transcription factor [Terriglobales bacterium]|nr:response regulator transcription factor [Terriglobales bacterium]